MHCYGSFSPPPHSRLCSHPYPTPGSVLTQTPLQAPFSPRPHSGLHSHRCPTLGSVLTPTPLRAPFSPPTQAPFSPLPHSSFHSHPYPSLGSILTPTLPFSPLQPPIHLSISVLTCLPSVCRGSVFIPKSIFVCFTYLLSMCRGSVFTIPLALYWHLSHTASQVSSISDDNNRLSSVLDKHAPLCHCTVRTRKPMPWFSSIVEQFCELKRERWQAERQ